MTIGTTRIILNHCHIVGEKNSPAYNNNIYTSDAFKIRTVEFLSACMCKTDVNKYVDIVVIMRRGRRKSARCCHPTQLLNGNGSNIRFVIVKIACENSNSAEFPYVYGNHLLVHLVNLYTIVLVLTNPSIFISSLANI